MIKITQDEARVDRPCPPWCHESLGHEWDGIERPSGRQCRDHAWDVNDNVCMMSREYADEAPGGAVCRQPVLRLWIGGNQADGEFTAADVRRIAADLLNAADELDKVAGGAS